MIETAKNTKRQQSYNHNCRLSITKKKLLIESTIKHIQHNFPNFFLPLKTGKNARSACNYLMDELFFSSKFTFHVFFLLFVNKVKVVV